MVDLATVLQITSALAVLIAAVRWLWGMAHKSGDTAHRFKQLEKLPARVDALEDDRGAVQERLQQLEAKAEHRKNDSEMMLKGLRACLEGMKEIGCNGEVTKTLAELNDYIIESR